MVFFIDIMNFSALSDVSRHVRWDKADAVFQAPAGRLGTAGIAASSKALIVDETYSYFLLLLTVSCIILKRKII